MICVHCNKKIDNPTVTCPHCGKNPLVKTLSDSKSKSGISSIDKLSNILDRTGINKALDIQNSLIRQMKSLGLSGLSKGLDLPTRMSGITGMLETFQDVKKPFGITGMVDSLYKEYSIPKTPSFIEDLTKYNRLRYELTGLQKPSGFGLELPRVLEKTWIIEGFEGLQLRKDLFIYQEIGTFGISAFGMNLPKLFNDDSFPQFGEIFRDYSWTSNTAVIGAHQTKLLLSALEDATAVLDLIAETELSEDEKNAVQEIQIEITSLRSVIEDIAQYLSRKTVDGFKFVVKLLNSRVLIAIVNAAALGSIFIPIGVDLNRGLNNGKYRTDQQTSAREAQSENLNLSKHESSPLKELNEISVKYSALLEELFYKNKLYLINRQISEVKLNQEFKSKTVYSLNEREAVALLGRDGDWAHVVFWNTIEEKFQAGWIKAEDLVSLVDYPQSRPFDNPET